MTVIYDKQRLSLRSIFFHLAGPSLTAAVISARWASEGLISELAVFPIWPDALLALALALLARRVPFNNSARTLRLLSAATTAVLVIRFSIFVLMQRYAHNIGDSWVRVTSIFWFISLLLMLSHKGRTPSPFIEPKHPTFWHWAIALGLPLFFVFEYALERIASCSDREDVYNYRENTLECLSTMAWSNNLPGFEIVILEIFAMIWASFCFFLGRLFLAVRSGNP